jgi:hypothetical protein
MQQHCCKQSVTFRAAEQANVCMNKLHWHPLRITAADDGIEQVPATVRHLLLHPSSRACTCILALSIYTIKGQMSVSQSDGLCP